MKTQEQISSLKDIEYQDFLEELIKELIDNCKQDDILLHQLIEHLDSQVSEDVRNVLSKMRDEKINTILNERP
jgi:hypothetical protein